MLTPEELKDLINNKEHVLIEIGCGTTKQHGAIGIDLLPLENVDFAANIEHGLGFIPDNSVDEIFSAHVLEHIENFDNLIKEIYRILKKDGIAKIIVPHFSNPYFYSDPTHKRFFGLYTFEYYSNNADSKYKRKVPNFYSTDLFSIEKKKIVFKSSFKIRNYIKQVFNRLFNSSIYLQELYEEVLCHIIPCQEIVFELRAKK